MFFVGTDDPDINAARILNRVKEGGHGVPVEKIHDGFGKSLANLAAAIPLCDRTYVYDNSPGLSPCGRIFPLCQETRPKLRSEAGRRSRQYRRTVTTGRTAVPDDRQQAPKSQSTIDAPAAIGGGNAARSAA